MPSLTLKSLCTVSTQRCTRLGHASAFSGKSSWIPPFFSSWGTATRCTDCHGHEVIDWLPGDGYVCCIKEKKRLAEKRLRLFSTMMTFCTHMHLLAILSSSFSLSSATSCKRIAYKIQSINCFAEKKTLSLARRSANLPNDAGLS